MNKTSELARKKVSIEFPPENSEHEIDSPEDIEIHRMGKPSPDGNETFSFLAAAAKSHYDFLGKGTPSKESELYDALIDAYADYVLNNFIKEYSGEIPGQTERSN